MSVMLLNILIAVTPSQAPPVFETLFAQVAPIPARNDPPILRSRGQTRAIVLIHGLHIYLFSPSRASEANFDEWQRSDSELVRKLRKHADIFSFCYGQTVTVEAVAQSKGLSTAISGLVETGYQEIVLVGFSAGGVIAREFVENNSKSGVTKIIQVCAPNTGSDWSNVDFGIPKLQQAFVTSLSPKSRQESTWWKADQTLPKNMEFVCVVSSWKNRPTDGVVTCRSQWSDDLRKQGIPAVPVEGWHVGMMKTDAVVEKLIELTVRPLRRWTPEEVKKAEPIILRE